MKRELVDLVSERLRILDDAIAIDFEARRKGFRFNESPVLEADKVWLKFYNATCVVPDNSVEVYAYKVANIYARQKVEDCKTVFRKNYDEDRRKS